MSLPSLNKVITITITKPAKRTKIENKDKNQKIGLCSQLTKSAKYRESPQLTT